MKRIVLVIIGLALAGINPARAQEVCVVCAGPDATYRCSIEKAEKLERFGQGGARAIQLVCAKELAREGGHASCAVRRDAAGPVCAGDVRIVSLASLLDTEARTDPSLAVPPPVPPAEVKTADPAASPPRTMLELAERTSAKSKQQLKDAGATVGGALEKTWDCLSSLFKRC